MTTRRVAAILSLVGLGLSLSLLTHANSQAASKSSRALSQVEMATTTGTGSNCNNYQCDNGNGCVDFNAYYITWYPKYICGWALYGSCSDFAYGLCYYKAHYSNLGCQNPAYRDPPGDTSYSKNYCGLG